MNAWDGFYPSLQQQMPDARFPEGTARTVDEEGHWLYSWDRLAAGTGALPDIQVPYYMDWAPFPEGEPFAPERHEAMTMQPSADVEPGVAVVLDEAQAVEIAVRP